MIGREILVDTSVVLDYLLGEINEDAAELLESSPVSISIMTFIEVCRYYYKKGRAREWNEVKSRLAGFRMLGVDTVTGEAAARAAAFENLSVADSIVYATALAHGLTLVTSDADLKNKKNVLYLKPAVACQYILRENVPIHIARF